MKTCEMVEQNKCLGCVGLFEADWCGKEQCSIYQELKNTTGLDLCKKIIEGMQMKM